MKIKKNNMKTGGKIAIGAGVAALVGAGAYYLFGTKNGKKTQKEIKSWIQKAEAEVFDKMKDIKEVNEDIYSKVISEVTAKYKALKEVDTKELEELSKHLKSQWKHVKKAFGTHSKK